MVFLLFMMFCASPVVHSQVPEWYIPLRDAIYEQELSADAVAPIYQTVSNRAKMTLSGYDQYILLSRCEYIMGKAYLYEERRSEASARFEDGMAFARRAIEARETADAWVMLGENLSQNIAALSSNVFYAMGNGLDVEKFARNALALNPRSASAQFLIAARWVYAPFPFNNIRRGIDLLNAIITTSDMDKANTFDVYSSLGYAYVQQRNSAQARLWLNRSLELYPTNKFVASLLAGLR